jgi:hypothetical protein
MSSREVIQLAPLQSVRSVWEKHTTIVKPLSAQHPVWNITYLVPEVSVCISPQQFLDCGSVTPSRCNHECGPAGLTSQITCTISSTKITNY